MAQGTEASGRAISRRQFLRLAGTGLAAMGLLAATTVPAAAAGTREGTYSRPRPQLGGTINVHVWDVKVPPEVIGPFEEEFGVTVNPVYFAENEALFSKLLAAGSTVDFDVFMGDGLWPRLYYDQGFAIEMNLDRVPSAQTLWPVFQPQNLSYSKTESGVLFGVPHTWGAILINYNPTEIPTAPTTWDPLFDPAYAGRITVMNWAIATIGTAALHLGLPGAPYNIDEAGLESVKQLLLAQKPLVRAYWGTNSELINLLGSGEVVVGHGLYEMSYYMAQEGFTVGSALPESGATGWIDQHLIGRDSPNKDAAYAWIEYYTRPETQKVFTKIKFQTTCSQGAAELLLAEGNAELVVGLHLDDFATFQRVYPFGPIANAAEWNAVWTEVTA